MEGVQKNVMAVPSTRNRDILKALLWIEWLRSWKMLLWFFAVWTVGLWVLPIFFHPAFLLGFGVLYVAVVGQIVAGHDALDGTAEFNLTLPPTREQIYAARAAFAGLPLVLLLGLGLLATRLEWPQAVWGLVVESGYTKPVNPASWAWFGSALAIPLAHFAWTFAMGSLARGALFASVAWIVGLLLTSVVATAGWLLEGALWSEMNGYLSVPILLAAAPVVLPIGLGLHRGREVTGAEARRGPLTRTWGWLTAIAILAVLLSGILFAVRASYRMAAMHEERAAAEAAARAQMEDEIRLEHEHEKATETPKEK